MVRHNSGRNTQRAGSNDQPPPYAEQQILQTPTTGNIPHQINHGSRFYGTVPQTSYSETVLLFQEKKGHSTRSTLLYILLAILATFAICSITMPITWCNDPLDPTVRDRIRKEWDAERRQHEALETRNRAQEIKWKAEEQAHGELTKRWEQERKDHEQYIKERDKREQEEREKLNMFWVDVQGHECTTYGTRTYSARLANVPPNYQRRVEACRTTPLVIHDISYIPITCEDKGSSGIIGHWRVSQNEPDCVSFWDSYKDQGCTSKGSRQRRIEHHLVNLPAGGDWREFAEATPVIFHGLYFPGAQAAFKTWLGAVYGQWEISDGEC
ncbi:hypothetical protein F5I97DRAFT_1917001 [Phlebopus sp. FC_14]|nr:hypothetical protein F5I97DRAFT_1917001 [Phlebopus sp. FC_14]